MTSLGFIFGCFVPGGGCAATFRMANNCVQTNNLPDFLWNGVMCHRSSQVRATIGTSFDTFVTHRPDPPHNSRTSARSASQTAREAALLPDLVQPEDLGRDQAEHGARSKRAAEHGRNALKRFESAESAEDRIFLAGSGPGHTKGSTNWSRAGAAEEVRSSPCLLTGL